jgi:predicted TIM-barrel fold metal-dependent hydrolase
MKIIDVHVHFYPDHIAGDAVRALTKTGEFEPCCDGTIGGLRQFMKKDGVGLAVNLPVATKKEQVAGINRRMIELNKQGDGDVLCFGTMHPEYGRLGNIREELQYLAENGVKGIKLHPDYQEFYPDEQKMTAVYEACRDYGLIISFHAGFDYPFPELTHGTPERFREVTKINGLKLIFAHMGGYRVSDGVLKYLVGTDAYFDTAFTFAMDEKLMGVIVDKHGGDRILFGSDFPWARQGAIKRKVEQAVADPEVRENIFHRNAEKLLDLPA